MGEFVTLITEDNVNLRAYRSAPDGKPRGGVVVLQEIFGVNHQIRSAADRAWLPRHCPGGSRPRHAGL
jgi:carboxymethylenebutenolidase